METKTKKVAVVGSGPAGLTAAIYLSRGQLDTTVFLGKQPGGQLTTTTIVENFPGFPEGKDGNQLVTDMQLQAQRFGTKLRSENVEKADLSKRPFILTTEKGEYAFDGLVIASGASARWIGLSGEEKYIGKGYASCATCDGFFYKGKNVIVVGGGDSAMEEANHLTHFADKVYIVHRRNEFRASKIMQNRVLSNPKVQVIWNTVVSAMHGENKLTAVTLKNAENGEEKYFPIDGLFVAIGHTPNSGWLNGQIETDADGYIITKNGTGTNIPGVHVAGDIADRRYRQAITAAGSGCQAAIDLERWLGVQTENYS